MFPARIIHPNVQVNDITGQFRNAASSGLSPDPFSSGTNDRTALQPGKLVKDEQFTLFEAVSALEIGDPKMDSGSVAFDPDTDIEFDFSATISPEETIWLMDELLCREVAWHKGYPLSQTLFTSVHIERLLWPEPKRLSDARFFRKEPLTSRPPSLLEDVFRPYCLALVKACDLVLGMVMSQHYYEEEDFASQIFNRPLLHIFSPNEILSGLQSAQAWLTQSDLSTESKEALADRLNLRSSFLKLLHICSEGDRPDESLHDECIAFLDRIEATTSIGRAVSTEAFTLKIQRKLASSVPPRPMVAIERPKAFPFLRQLITDTITAFQLLDVSFSADLLVAYQQFTAQERQPAVYVRALLQAFLYLNNHVLGRYSSRDFILQDMRILVLPTHRLLSLSGQNDEEIFTDAQFNVASQFDIFINRTAESFLNLFRTVCLNRPRVRRTMCHAAQEWDQIQAEAEELDTLIQSAFDEQPIPYPDSADGATTFSYSLSSWFYHYKLIQLRTIVQMGFELSIYAPHEFRNMYWYLSFLCGTHMSHLERISYFVSSSAAASSQSDTNPESQQAAVQRTLHHLYRQFTFLKATESLAKSLHRLFVILERHGLLVEPTFPYSSDKMRYELRMRPFLPLAIPEPIGEDVARHVSSLAGLSDEEVLEQAAAMNQVARRAWEEVLREPWHTEPLEQDPSGTGPTGRPGQKEKDKGKADKTNVVEREWTKDVRNSMKSCIGTGIAISTLTKALKEQEVGRLKVEMPIVGERDRWHVAWVVPKIKN
ncbi:N-alpha-acetyltransferase, non-catalitic subunit [Exophiala xenobiotica]|nr:N-alpha-acetyltransferase, non-catalitic subunit [Exophiala xenobiotica]KAK5211606.1 N-alpha-acetyltransferase, non-catalitic subunit [Exophiala xenobiotica]KAK5222681.1 N-alpha-acetyltransferase, non-catalitic subunit [Exophiala xenobiotica]KAK5233706.1 N-alpha-acetyltransferase, non-catalitic subunit [Exophiala xenobiotica]KAK5247966.1 N-alpha-acetyltransferase, non-catalitic subunit [Exophiala xenobiotica]